MSSSHPNLQDLGPVSIELLHAFLMSFWSWALPVFIAKFCYLEHYIICPILSYKVIGYLIELMRFRSQKIKIWTKIHQSYRNNVTGGVMLEEPYMHYRVEETIFLRSDIMPEVHLSVHHLIMLSLCYMYIRWIAALYDNIV